MSGLDPAAVVPTVGSKEFIAWLPTLLGLGAGDVVVHPEAAYPTYAVGALLAGAEAVAADDLDALAPEVRERVRLVWTNSPANPTGAVLDAAALRRTVDAARGVGAVVCGDECYAELGWDAWDGAVVPCILSDEVSGGDLTGLLSVYSLSKQSNLAGYRAAFAAGDPELVATLVNTRKHAGMIVPAPVQHAMAVALADDAHVAEQKDRYRRRRDALRTALEASGHTVDHSGRGCTCGPGGRTWTRPTPRRRTRGICWATWRTWASSPGPACSTVPAATATSAWRSPPRTRRSPGPRRDSRPAGRGPAEPGSGPSSGKRPRVPGRSLIVWSRVVPAWAPTWACEPGPSRRQDEGAHP